MSSILKPKSDADINAGDRIPGNVIATYAWNEFEKAKEHCSRDKNCGGVVLSGKRGLNLKVKDSYVLRKGHELKEGRVSMNHGALDATYLKTNWQSCFG